MPCDSSYMEPNQTEKNRVEVSQFLVFVFGKLGKEVSKNIVNAANSQYGEDVDLDEVVALLCSTIRKMSKKQLENIVYDAHNGTSRRLANWWEEHQKADEERILHYNKKLEEQRKRKNILKKLTDEEIKFLGLKK